MFSCRCSLKPINWFQHKLPFNNALAISDSQVCCFHLGFLCSIRRYLDMINSSPSFQPTQLDHENHIDLEVCESTWTAGSRSIGGRQVLIYWLHQLLIKHLHFSRSSILCFFCWMTPWVTPVLPMFMANLRYPACSCFSWLVHIYIAIYDHLW